MRKKRGLFGFGGKTGADSVEGGGEKRRLRADTLEARVLLSSTWADAAGEEIDGPTGGDDVFAGGNGQDVVDGLEGDDSLFGNGGHDLLAGGEGDNEIHGGKGSDTITAGSGSDTISGGDGNDAIDAGDGDNIVNGGSGSDTITTGSGDDVIDAGSGKNVVDAGEGDNVVTGGGNDDAITTGSGDDVIDAGNGSNVIDAGEGDNTVTSGKHHDTITTGDGVDVIDSGGGHDVIDAGEGENVVDAGDGKNRVIVGDGDDVVTSGRGSDVIDAGHGANVIDSGSGSDTITTGSGDDVIDAGSGKNVVDAGEGDNVVTGGGNDDAITTGSGDDVINAGNGSNVVSSGDGDDTITTGKHSDVIDAGGGDDVIKMGGGNDVVDGGSGHDVVSFEGSARGVDVDITLGGESQNTGEGRDTFTGVEGIVGSSHNDTFAFSAPSDGAAYTVDGGGGENTLDLRGFSSSDAVRGGSVITVETAEVRFTIDQVNISEVVFADGGLSPNDIAEPVNLDDGLVLHMAFDDAGGDAGVDSSLAGNDGRESGDVVVEGGAGEFDGDDALLVDSDASINLVTVPERTVAVSFTPSSTDGRVVVFEEGGSARGVNVYMDEGEIFVGGWNKPAGESGWGGTFLSVGTVEPGERVDIALTLSGGEDVSDDALRAFRDGELVQSGEGSQLWPHGSPTGIGDDNGGTLFHDGSTTTSDGFEGEIEDLRVYDRVLNDTEIDAVRVGDVNEAPTDISFTGGGVDEGAAAGTVVAVASAVDADAGDAHTYELVDDADGRFVIDGSTGEVSVAEGAELDHETDASHSVTVRAVDAEGASVEQTLTVEVGDVNEGPAVEVGDAQVVVEGEAVVLSVTATDVEGDALTYAWTQTGGPSVELGDASSSTPGFTAPDIGSDSTLTFEVVVSDGEHEVVETVTVEVEANAAPAVHVGDDVSVDEGDLVTLSANAGSSAAGPVVDFESVEISDHGGSSQNRGLDVDVTGESIRLEGNGWRSLDIGGTVTDTTVLEFEFRSTAEGEIHGVGFASSDGLDEGRFFKVMGTQNWGQDADVSVSADGEWVKVSIPVGDTFTGDYDRIVLGNDHDVNDADANSEFRNLRVYDGAALDAGGVDSDLKYSWEQVSGPAADLGDASSAELSFDAPSVDETTEMVFRVTVSDGDHESMDEVRVTVEPTNEAPTSIGFTGGSVAEGASAGTVVATASAIDGDTGDTHTYELVDDASGRFVIDGSSGEVSVAEGAVLDHESAESHSVTVRAVDSEGASVDEVLTIEVGDVNEAIESTEFVPAGAAETVSYGFEDMSAGDRPTLVDFGGGVTGAVTYAGSVESTIFEGTDGHGAVASEGDMFWKLLGGETTLEFSEPLSEVSFSYSDFDGRADITAGVNGVKTPLEHVSQNENHLMTLRAPEGQTIESITFGWADVRGADGIGIDGFVLTTVGDADAPAVVAEDASGGEVVGSVRVSDPDAGETFVYRMIDDGDGRFEVDDTGTVRVTAGASFDYEGEPSVGVRVEVVDSAGHVSETAFDVAIGDVNEGPGALHIGGGAVHEDATAGTLVARASAVDPDAGDVLTYALADDAGGRFVIDTTTGDVLLAPGADLSGTGGSTHDVVVRATDSSGSFVDGPLVIEVRGGGEASADAPTDEVDAEVRAGGAAAERASEDVMGAESERSPADDAAGGTPGDVSKSSDEGAADRSDDTVVDSGAVDAETAVDAASGIAWSGDEDLAVLDGLAELEGVVERYDTFVGEVDGLVGGGAAVESEGALPMLESMRAEGVDGFSGSVGGVQEAFAGMDVGGVLDPVALPELSDVGEVLDVQVGDGGVPFVTASGGVDTGVAVGIDSDRYVQEESSSAGFVGGVSGMFGAAFAVMRGLVGYQRSEDDETRLGGSGK